WPNGLPTTAKSSNRGCRMTAEQNSFHRWSGSPTICYDTNAIWEISAKGKGKSGGVRVIYYYHSHQMPLYLFSVFGKSDKDNLTRAEENDLRQVTAGIKAVHRGRRRT
ncbi:MAG: type II toxin-antitoxin system RelE/ParE family toxin, partial [Alphaproteobacteria bacterium]|nr:type II toxin-antitoxin system RelE/ParE family toxin [Alphaproteobacteria bacterium]